jgi:putative membrane protein
MRNSVRLGFSISCAALATFLAAPVLGQGMAGHTAAPNAGDASTMSNPDPASMDRMTTPPGEGGELRGGDREFMMDAARGGMAEVELGKLAVSKGSSPEIKRFGQKMVDDHSRANDKLRQVAAAKRVTLPSGLDRATRSEIERLEKMPGDRFDRAYADLMVKDHKKDVAAFDREAKRAGADPAVRDFASSTLPVVQDHLSMVQDLQARMSASFRTGTQR